MGDTTETNTKFCLENCFLGMLALQMPIQNKGLGRAPDLCTNGSLLSKLMKLEVFILEERGLSKGAERL